MSADKEVENGVRTRKRNIRRISNIFVTRSAGKGLHKPTQANKMQCYVMAVFTQPRAK